jgi:hypothetical protein
MADVEEQQPDPGPGEKEANKPPSPKPDTDEVAPPLVSTTKSKFFFVYDIILS